MKTIKSKFRIQELLTEYPNLLFENGLYNGDDDELIVPNELAKMFIEDYYDGSDITVNYTDNNPENEETRTVDGKEFIEYEYEGDYQEALEQIW